MSAKKDDVETGYYVGSEGNGKHTVAIPRENGVVLRTVREPKPGESIPPGARVYETTQRGHVVEMRKMYERPPLNATPAETSNGPAKVATDDFRSGWERTFGKKKELDPTLN